MRPRLIEAALVLAIAGPALAEQISTVTARPAATERVPYQASELQSAVGIRALRKRVFAAARRVCTPTDEELLSNGSLGGCLKPTMRNADAQIERHVAARSRGAAAAVTAIVVSVR